MQNDQIRISIEELRPGMFIEDVYSSKGLLLYCAETVISDERQIDILKKQGITNLCINIAKGIVLEDYLTRTTGLCTGETDSASRIYQPILAQYERKLGQAYAIHTQTIETVRIAMRAVCTGRMFSVRTVRNATETMISRVLEDPDVYLGLFQIKAYDTQTYAHSVNVAVLAAALASGLGYSDDRILEIGIGCMLHDIGKMRIPEEILRNEGRYTRLELEIMKTHPQLGLDLIQGKSDIPAISRNIIVQHHERWNGGGYPAGLKGEKIDEFAMVCALADVYDALTTDFLYRQACLPQHALALIFQGSDEEYPRMLVEHFTKLLGIYPVGSFVKLDSGEMGLVIRINRRSLLKPTVLILFGENGSRISNPYIRDLSDTRLELERALWSIESSLDPKTFNIDPPRYFSEQKLN